MYIREAHPKEGWSLSEDFQGKYDVHDPETLAERIAMCKSWIADLASDNRIGRPSSLFVVDAMDDASRLAYDAMPERLYIVEDGIVTFRSGQGPMGYSVPDLKAYLAHRFADEDD